MDIINVPVSVMELFLPEDTLKWFNIIDAKKMDNVINIILEEKNTPPVPNWTTKNKISSKGFKDITVTDFPIRGKKVLLNFKRRYWKIKDHDILLKRDIKLVAEGTLLEKEFADFLKE